MDKNKRGLLNSFLEHRNQLFRVIGRIVRPDEIEDIVQETFVQSYAAARNQQIHNPKAFMFRTARNLALNSIKRSGRKLNSSIDDLQEYEIAPEGNPVEEGCQSEEKFLNFCRAVSYLPVSCRRVFILKKVYGLTQKEIAEFLDITPSTVEKHLARGMSATAEYMYQAGYPNTARPGNPAGSVQHAFSGKDKSS